MKQCACGDIWDEADFDTAGRCVNCRVVDDFAPSTPPPDALSILTPKEKCLLQTAESCADDMYGSGGATVTYGLLEIIRRLAGEVAAVGGAEMLKRIKAENELAERDALLSSRDKELEELRGRVAEAVRFIDCADCTCGMADGPEVFAEYKRAVPNLTECGRCAALAAIQNKSNSPEARIDNLADRLGGVGGEK